MADELIGRLAASLPAVVRWAGGVARQLRRYDIAIAGKNSGAADTDALTLADLSVQELLVAALRDLGPPVRDCCIEAEESSGDLACFAADSPYVIAIDPIDGTQQYRDRTGDAYSVMVHLRTRADVLYSLVYLPEQGPAGTWLEARPDGFVLGPDDPSRPARAVLDTLAPVRRRADSRRVVLANFFGRVHERAALVTAAGLDACAYADAPGSLFPLLASGEIAGALYHTPNVYDFPVAMHLARLLGGDAVWVHDGRRADFRAVWRDARGAGMLRLPDIVACAADRSVLDTLVAVARDWSRDRYGTG
jgi:3'(2'), 5'-bisphosphate nucleotidase